MFYLANVTVRMNYGSMIAQMYKNMRRENGDEVVMTAWIDKQCVHKMWTVINEIPSLTRHAIYHI